MMPLYYSVKISRIKPTEVSSSADGQLAENKYNKNIRTGNNDKSSIN